MKTIYDIFVRVADGLTYITGWITALCLVAAAFIVTEAVIVRKLLGISTIWQIEASVLLLIFTVFAGAPFVQRNEPHLLSTIPYVLHGSMDSFALLAIPLFILLSAPIAASHASKDLYETLHKWLHKIPGGLGIANMVGCGIFAALCGSSPATAAAIGGIGIPEMRRRGYSQALANGLIAHAGTFGILMPPSVTMILYGVATETSIGKCFIAGVVPGILLVVLSCVWLGIVFFYRKFVPARRGSTYFFWRPKMFMRYSHERIDSCRSLKSCHLC